MHLAGLLALVLDGEPVINAVVDTQGTQLDNGLANQVTRGHVFIEHGHGHIVANVLHVDVEDLVPLGGLASTLQCSGLQFLVPRLNLAPGVHLAEPFGVSGKFGLNDAQTK